MFILVVLICAFKVFPYPSAMTRTFSYLVAFWVYGINKRLNHKVHYALHILGFLSLVNFSEVLVPERLRKEYGEVAMESHKTSNNDH